MEHCDIGIQCSLIPAPPLLAPSQSNSASETELETELETESESSVYLPSEDNTTEQRYNSLLFLCMCADYFFYSTVMMMYLHRLFLHITRESTLYLSVHCYHFLKSVSIAGVQVLIPEFTPLGHSFTSSKVVASVAMVGSGIASHLSRMCQLEIFYCQHPYFFLELYHLKHCAFSKSLGVHPSLCALSSITSVHICSPLSCPCGSITNLHCSLS